MSRNKENKPMIAHQRANGSLLSSTRTPHSEDFFTDSILDASRIPSPSPQKQQYGNGYIRNRRALTKPTLTDAWNRTAGLGKGSTSSGEMDSKPTVPQKNNEKVRTAAQLKPRTLAEIWNGQSPIGANGTLQGRKSTIEEARRSQAPDIHQSRQRTPSPSRRPKKSSVHSPTSEVSQDLTDVYERIEAEADLAAQEGQLEDEEEDDYTEGSVHESLEFEVTEDQRQNLSQPILQQESQRQMFDRSVPYGDEQDVGEGITSLSEASGLSFLRNLTDQGLAAALTPQIIDRAKDRALLERAINKETPLFTHRQRFNHGLTSENLQRNGTASNGPFVRKNSSSGSVTTDRSDPPLNVPRQWGRRSRPGREWLRSRREGSVQSSPGPDISQVDWAAAAAGVALPSVEDSSTPRIQPSAESTTASLRRQTSADRIRQWELHDFTGQSLQVSNSPPVRIKPPIPDQNREREIEGLERQAVTTSRLTEIGRKNSNELPKRLSRSPSAATPGKEIEYAVADEKSKERAFFGEGEQIPGTPIVVHRSTSGASNSGSEVPGERQTHDRKKSHDHLQRLARALSNSPRASPSPEEWSLVGSDEGLKRSQGPLDKPNEAIPRSDGSRRSSKQVVDIGGTHQAAMPPIPAETPVVTGAWTDTILPPTARTVRQPGNRAKYAQTPLVNPGGWIDTPTTKKRHSSVLAPIPIEEETEEITNDIPDPLAIVSHEIESPPVDQVVTPRPAEMPTSALAGLLERAKRRLESQDVTGAKDGNDTLNLGDATIESLEDLLTLDAADMTTLIRIGAEAEAHDQLVAGLHRNDPAAEAELLERLGTKLERLRTNIHDARKGISKLEHQVTHPSSGDQQLQRLTPDGPCEACGCPRTVQTLEPSSPSQRLYITLPIPRLFHSRRKDLGHWLPRPTWLGWLTLLVWLWYMSESVMCELYCHPLYADRYVWPREPEPVFPWALPTMLWRWSRVPGMLGPVWRMLVAVARIVGQLAGWSDGFVEGAYRGSVGAAGGGGDFGVPAAAGAGLGEGIDYSMMNDEYM